MIHHLFKGFIQEILRLSRGEVGGGLEGFQGYSGLSVVLEALSAPAWSSSPFPHHAPSQYSANSLLCPLASSWVPPTLESPGRSWRKEGKVGVLASLKSLQSLCSVR